MLFLRKWQYKRLLKKAQAYNTIDKLRVVNRFWNHKIQYKNAPKDHYQTPAETMELGTGDCEDYCLAKMDTLIALGFDPIKIRLVATKYQQIPHMTLLVCVDETWYRLDNNWEKVPEVEFETMARVYSMNISGVYVNGKLTTSEHSKFRKVLEKVEWT